MQQFPVATQALGFTKTAMKVYNTTSPVEVVHVATVSIIEDCAPPEIKYSIKYCVFFA